MQFGPHCRLLGIAVLGFLTSCQSPFLYQDMNPPRYSFPTVGGVERAAPDELGPVLSFQPIIFRFNRLQRTPPRSKLGRGR